jgi:hypothetical protein
MSHKKVHSLGFADGRNELAGLVEAVPHGPFLMEVTMTFDPVKMQEQSEEANSIRLVMTKDAWNDLEPTLVRDPDTGKLTALAVNRPSEFRLERLPPSPENE